MENGSEEYQIVVFGTGGFAQMVVTQLSEPVLMYLDNDEKKHRTEINGINIYLPEILIKKSFLPYKVLVASSYYKEISLQLIGFGLVENQDFYNAKWLFIEQYMEKRTWLHELEYLKQKILFLKEVPIKSLLKTYLDRYTELNPTDKRIKLIKNNITIDDLNEDEVKLIYSSKIKEDTLGMKIKNIHFIMDNMASKAFYDYIQRENYKHHNLFILIDIKNSFVFFEKEIENIYKIPYSDIAKYSLNYWLIDTINRSENVYIHFLFDSISDLFENPLICKPKTHWIIWGSDLYSDLNIQLYGEKTKELFVDKFLMDKRENKTNKVKFIKELDKVLTGIKGEFNLVKDHYETSAQYINFHYPSYIDMDILDKVIAEGSGNHSRNINVLVGNSGSQANNHIEVFDVLLKYLDEITQIIVPLSYGDEVYVKQISQYGKRMFGNKFKPMYEFLGGYEYGKLINDCDFIFMNHRRQQGFGNILISLYLGKAVYLSENVTTYNTLIEWGVQVNCIESFLYNPFNKLEDQLSGHEECVARSAINQKILRKHTEDIVEIYQNLFS